MVSIFFDALLLKKSESQLTILLILGGRPFHPPCGKSLLPKARFCLQEPDFQAWGNEKGLTPGTGMLFWHVRMICKKKLCGWLEKKCSCIDSVFFHLW
jgi:hypothetical protein